MKHYYVMRPAEGLDKTNLFNRFNNEEDALREAARRNVKAGMTMSSTTDPYKYRVVEEE